MDSPKIEVNCGVENCHYNKQHKCYAKSLEVNPMGGKQANTSDSTCCTTFIDQK